MQAVFLTQQLILLLTIWFCFELLILLFFMAFNCIWKYSPGQVNWHFEWKPLLEKQKWEFSAHTCKLDLQTFQKSEDKIWLFHQLKCTKEGFLARLSSLETPLNELFIPHCLSFSGVNGGTLVSWLRFLRSSESEDRVSSKNWNWRERGTKSVC